MPAPTDLAAFKLARLSGKVRAFVQELLGLGLVQMSSLLASVSILPIETERKEAARQYLASIDR